ncbi:unnamed protein product [Phytophthora fragariaefolia]|uniref:Unnamed protein product n=1 Tax=Phytophthora fragariaefolia TaxID=1490495 RepID=A0A9W6X545_9STRA|nr:unnamed protein product [Phytophthora fragariaefolia]
MRQPRGFEEGGRSKVWRLKKALYGLKQADREWNSEINRFLVELGIVPTREGPCVYIHPTNNLIVLIYVDDILIGYQEEREMDNLMLALREKYGVKDLGEINWFLGICIRMDSTQGITTLDQSQFAVEILRRIGMEDCRARKTPIDKGVILYRRSPDEESAGDVPYRQAVGALLYLARVTRPDIAYAVNQVADTRRIPPRLIGLPSRTYSDIFLQLDIHAQRLHSFIYSHVVVSIHWNVGLQVILYPLLVSDRFGSTPELEHCNATTSIPVDTRHDRHDKRSICGGLES